MASPCAAAARSRRNPPQQHRKGRREISGPFAVPGNPLAHRAGGRTVGQLADQLGFTKKPSPALAGKADAAYAALKYGDTAPARILLVDDLGVSEQKADEAIAKLPGL